jgi:hypothetical protein
MDAVNKPKLLLDPYLSWAENERVPITDDFGVDLLKVPTAKWPLMGVEGGIVHLKGRGDFVSVFVLDLAPGAKTEPQKHLFEEVVYVLYGHGSTVIETSDGHKHSFEWGPKSLFALPLNCRYQHFNSSGRSARVFHRPIGLPTMLNLFHNEAFVFDNSYQFVDRQGAPDSSRARVISFRCGRAASMWETNFIPDLAAFELKAWDQRRWRIEHDVHSGGRHHMPHSSQMPVGTIRKRTGMARTSMCSPSPGMAIRCCGMTARKISVRVDWQHGVVFAPPDQMFHQHFNTAQHPARYLAVAMGSLRYPFTADKKRVFMGMDVNVKDGGCQIEYEHQDPRIHKIFLSELAAHGVKSAWRSLSTKRRNARSRIRACSRR